MTTFDHTQTLGLTPRQASALPHLASAGSLNQGAIRAQIARSTLSRWMRDSRFRSELQHMRDEAASLAKTKLQGLMLKSVLVLDEALDDPSPALRQRAARDVIGAALKSQEIDELRDRMDVLDTTLTVVKKQK
jgi:hypothetical protein